jgi:antitoxin (DNA-binding transcriptional repressor) of toxin-antitoxin stability system
MKSVTVHEAKTTLSKLLADTAEGEEIIICRGRQPVARLLALHPPTRGRPRVGEITSESVTHSDDCFSPMSDEEAARWGLG